MTSDQSSDAETAISPVQVDSPRSSRLAHPTREFIASLPPFKGLEQRNIYWVNSRSAADSAIAALKASPVVGFDTESKPVFVAGAPRTGPHLVQISLGDRCFCLPTESDWAIEVASYALQAETLLKVGFGVSNDRKPLSAKLRIKLRSTLDLATVVRRIGYRQRVGLQAAVAIVLGKRLNKSKRLQTSNWAARPLSASQLAYAANDAYASLHVYEALAQTHPEWLSTTS